MAWQTAPGLVIIGGGFAVAGGLFMGIDYLNRWICNRPRYTGQSNFTYLLDRYKGKYAVKEN